MRANVHVSAVVADETGGTLAAMDGSPVSKAEHAPFALYGLSDEFVARRSVAGIGRHGHRINLVAVDHGDRWSFPHVWVQVTVMGPRRGATPTSEGRGGAARTTWSIDPLPMIVTELLNVEGVEASTVAELEDAQHALLSRGFRGVHLQVDGRPELFRMLRTDRHRAALHDIAPDHLLYMIASNVEPSQLALVALDDLRAYGEPASA